MNLYPWLMQRVILPTIAQLTRVKIWDHYKMMMQVEKLTLDELNRQQFLKLRKILNFAYATVPFYRRRFDEIGLEPNDIQDEGNALPIPPTTKEDIMSNFPEGITAQGLDRSRWKYVASSGTTRQIMGIHDFRKANINWAAGLRAHKLAGNYHVGKKWMEIPPHMCTNICGIDDSGKAEQIFSKKLFSLFLKGDLDGLGQQIYQYLYSQRQKLYRRITLPSFGQEGTNIPEKDLTNYINNIREHQPYLLEGLPLYLYTFAKYLIRKGIPSPTVGVFKPFGGSMTSVMKETIKKAFGSDVYDTYGCSEMGFVASDCEKHEGLHLFMDLYYVEICRDGKVVAPGELGRLYVTDLENRAMPWIRYDIGDVGRYFVNDHGCGRKSIRLQVEGRIEDALSNSKSELFTSDQVFDFFHAFKEIDNFQLIEKSRGDFDLLCVPSPGASIDKASIAREFIKFFDPDASIRTYIVKTIKAEDGGKFRFVKSKSFEEA
ncbi:MAG: phenylacetate--CoA ligase family protein [Candidatus Hodarchaeota archaeon]